MRLSGDFRFYQGLGFGLRFRAWGLGLTSLIRFYRDCAAGMLRASCFWGLSHEARACPLPASPPLQQHEGNGLAFQALEFCRGAQPSVMKLGGPHGQQSASVNEVYWRHLHDQGCSAAAA